MSYRIHSKGNYGLQKVQRFHNRRSNRAKRIDESLRAPIAKTVEQWMNQPNRFDFPDVDTPKKTDDLERQLERHKASRSPSNLRQVRANLARHKLYGNTH